jgi:TetR/AcrR family transcriptional regulator, regulator of autoinduction and epiphytic fitness
VSTGTDSTGTDSTGTDSTGTDPTGTGTTGPADGRNLRRERNREAVVTALLEIYREGNLGPSAEEIAARAGISARSLFRYFADVEDLVRTAIARQQQHLAPLAVLDIPTDLPLAERVERFVAARVRLLEGMGEVGRVARSIASRQPLVLAELARIRGNLRRQLTALFAPELAAMSPAGRRAAAAAADVVCSWESFDLMHNDQGLSRDDAAAAMRAALLRLLGDATTGPGDA